MRRRLALSLASLAVVSSLTFANPVVAEAAPAAPGALIEKGVTLWAWDDFAYGPKTEWADTPAALDALGEVGANTVALVPTWVQAFATSSSVTREPGKTATDEALRHGIAVAHARGLAVTLKPHVNVLDGSWRGSIKASNVDAWFVSYRQMLLGYARLAQETGVSQFVVGTELVEMSRHTSRWRSLIAEVRKTYRGRLTYAALPFEYARIGFWRSLDVVGIDAYWRLSRIGSRTDVASLQAEWSPIVDELAAFSASVGRPILITEAGYTDQVGTTRDPASWTLAAPSAGGAVEQANAYQALLISFTGKTWFRGVHWWAWRQTNQTLSGDYTPQGKPAGDVLRAAWVG